MVKKKILIINNKPMEGSSMKKETKISLYTFPIYFLTVAVVGTLVLTLDATPNTFMSLIPVALIGVITTATTLRKYNYDANEAKELLKINKTTIKKIILNGLLGATIFIILSIIISYIGENFYHNGDQVSKTTETASQLHNPLAIILAIISIGVLIPFIEEFLFRGLIMGALQKTKINHYAKGSLPLIINSLMFSVMHFQGLSSFTDASTLIITFIMGLVNSLIATRTNSVYNSVAAHAAVNTMQMLILYS